MVAPAYLRASLASTAGRRQAKRGSSRCQLWPERGHGFVAFGGLPRATNEGDILGWGARVHGVDGALPCPSERADTGGHGEPMRGLLVEDDRAIADAMQRVLARAGLVVDHASTLSRARERLKKHRYAFLILDRCLPDGDSIDLCRERRADGDRCFIAFFSGIHTVEEQKVAGYDAGADVYFSKAEGASVIVKHLKASLDVRARALRLGGLQFDPCYLRLSFPDGTVADLTPAESRFLLTVVDCAPEEASEQSLGAAVWAGMAHQRSGLAGIARRLRLKLGGFDWMLQTVHGEGAYQWVIREQAKTGPAVKRAPANVAPAQAGEPDGRRKPDVA